MMSTDLEVRLGTVLGAPVTTAQRAKLDARMTARLSGRPARPGSLARRRSFLAILAVLALSTAAVVGVSAGMRLTEDPRGLASADEFAHELETAEQVVPIPPGATWPNYLTVTDRNGSYSRGGGRSWVEFVAVCLWSDSWLAADRSGDVATRAMATATLRDVRSWEVYTGSDPIHGVRAMFDLIIEAASRGDPALIQSFVALNCAP